MSNYPEADEAQRRHYQDGYNPYGYTDQHQNQDPFDNDANQRNSYYPQQQQQPYPTHQSSYPPVGNAPYVTSHTPVPYGQAHFTPPPPPPPLDAYGAPVPVHSPPPDQQRYTLPPLGAPIHSPPPPPPQLDSYGHELGYGQQPYLSPPPVHDNLYTPDSTMQTRQSYQLHDDGPNNDADDGDIPLLRRDSSSSAMQLSMPMPGDYMGAGSGPNEEDDDELNMIRYGRIPQRVPRRYKTLKKVELFHGNFVLDSQVPSKLLDLCAHKADREFTHMRYSAATCDPNDFKDSGFTLRQVHYDPPRRTELFIVMTMYNEDEELFCRTMHGVMRNVAHLCKRDRSKTWGKEGWKKVVVCIVSDGRQKINSRTLSVIAAMGGYQEGIAKNVINKKPVTAHIYEYTTQICLTPNLKIEGPEKGMVPVQLLFCLKEKNQKKINSHRWFFNAFGPILQPNVCVLLDVGTMPGVTSIYHLWKAFDINSNVGGACGEIVALKGKWGLNLLNPLVAAQNFEYKMSNILDKPLESVFGYITVLPGAFSAYRYIALQNDVRGEGPLQKYFLGEKMHGAGADIFTANMYLAEDRILCWELVSKRGGSWTLHYVKSAYAVTDVPDEVAELISQRRRWLNGSFFAAVHSTVHFHYIYRSAHSLMRKFWIHVEMVYQLFNLIFSWFSLANLYIAFHVLSDSLEDPSFNLKGINVFNIILNYMYIGLIILCFLLSLGNRPQGSKWGYLGAMIGFAIVTVYMTATAILLAYKGIEGVKEDNNGSLNIGDLFTNSIFFNIVLSLAATVGLYLVASLIFFEPWHMITSFFQYTLIAPSYIAVLNVYAFANVHDVSWGTKGDNKVSTDLGVVSTGKDSSSAEVMIPTEQTDINAAYEDALQLLQTKPPKADSKPDESTIQEDYYRTFRTNVLLAWTLSNGLLAAVITSTNGSAADDSATSTVSGYMTFLLYSVAGLAFIRFVGSTTYMVVRLFAGE